MTDIRSTAKFRDIPFFCLSVESSEGNALVKTSYPHREGQHIENLGRLGAKWQVRAVWAPDIAGRGEYPEDYWPNGYQRMREACLENRERGYFTHPLFGQAYAQCADIQVTADGRNGIFATIQFEEANLDEPTYELLDGDRSTTESGGEDRASDLDTLFVAAVGVNESPFSDAWVAYMSILHDVNRVLTTDDVTVGLNTFHAALTATAESYPEVNDPINWDIQYQTSLLRRDANILAQRYGANDLRITLWENKATRSTAEIAAILYFDHTRASEIERLNRIQDPLFVPPGFYRVTL